MIKLLSLTFKDLDQVGFALTAMFVPIQIVDLAKVIKTIKFFPSLYFIKTNDMGLDIF